MRESTPYKYALAPALATPLEFVSRLLQRSGRRWQPIGLKMPIATLEALAPWAQAQRRRRLYGLDFGSGLCTLMHLWKEHLDLIDHSVQKTQNLSIFFGFLK